MPSDIKTFYSSGVGGTVGMMDDFFEVDYDSAKQKVLKEFDDWRKEANPKIISVKFGQRSRGDGDDYGYGIEVLYEK